MKNRLDEPLDDLATEYERLNAILGDLDQAAWQAQSGAPGWTVLDVVIHLDLSEAAVSLTLQHSTAEWTTREHALDAEMAGQVQASQASS